MEQLEAGDQQSRRSHCPEKFPIQRNPQPYGWKQAEKIELTHRKKSLRWLAARRIKAEQASDDDGASRKRSSLFGRGVAKSSGAAAALLPERE